MDILLVELIKVVNWFNPVVHLLHRSIKLNHEYIADEIAACGNNDRADYAQILMCQALGAPIHTLSNNFFNQSFTKKRIAMLFKSKSKKLVLSRFFLLIPVMLVCIAFQAKESVLSKVQVLDLDDNAFAEGFQMNTGNTFTAVEVPRVPPYTLPILVGQGGESNKPVPTSPSSSTITLQTDKLLFVAVEEPPVPVDGMPAFLKYVGTNYVYPKEAEDAKVNGRLTLTFVVEKDGSISDIKSERDLGYGTGEEAIRVLQASPKWKPGRQRGKVVRVQYTLPIVLNLDGDSAQE